MRESGSVAKSTEIVSLAALLSSLVLLRWGGGALVASALELIRGVASEVGADPLESNPNSLAIGVIVRALPLLIPLVLIMCGIAFLSLAASIAQVGFFFAPNAIMPKLDRLSPSKNIKDRIIGRMGMEFVKNIVKFSIVGVVASTVLYSRKDELLTFASLPLEYALGTIADLAIDVATKTIVAFGVLAFVDLFYQRRKYAQSAKMTRDDWVHDMKSSMGDPQMRQRIQSVRSRMRNLVGEKDVPGATVVVTNPTHVAVAIRYRHALEGGPRVVAKGEGLRAEKIKQLAREAGVPIVEQPPLARELYKHVEVGGEVPDVGDLWALLIILLQRVYELYPQLLERDLS